MSKAKASLQKIQTSLVGGKRQVATMNHWVPNTDVYVTENALVIKVELSGMSREHLELSIEDHRLVIRGQRPDGCRAPKCTFLAMAINYGSFECSIDVPAGYDMANAQAAYHNGFLRIDIPADSHLDSARAAYPSNDEG